MTVLFSDTKSEDTPYLWEYVYRIEGLEDFPSDNDDEPCCYDYVYSNRDKPLVACIVQGEYRSSKNYNNNNGTTVIAALYYNDTLLSGRVFPR